MKKQQGAVDWSRSAAALKNQVRAFQPWPTSYTFWQREGGQPLRLILERVSVAAGAEPSLAQQEGEAPAEPASSRATESSNQPGTVLVASGEQLLVATGEGTLAIERIQPAGKRALSAAEFLRGYGVRPGERFGHEA